MTDFNFKPTSMPLSRRELGIGIVGSGGIVRGAHLPAYKMANFRVAAIAARNVQTRGEAAQAFGIPLEFGDWRQLVERDDIDVLDIAIPGEGRLEIVRAAAAAGKHLLMQKPLANSMDEAREMVAIAADAGISLAVNQNARWASVYRAAAAAIRQGLIGEVFDITHTMRNNQGTVDWFVNGWYGKTPRFQILQYMVHYIDVVRMWLGTEPVSVLAKTYRRRGQAALGELAADVLLSFPGDVNCLLSDRNYCWRDEQLRVGFFIEGSQGVIEGNVQTGALTIRSSRLEAPYETTLGNTWFPDGFAHTMGHLLDAVATGSPLETSGADNLKTLVVVDAAYRSAETGAVCKVPISD